MLRPIYSFVLLAATLALPTQAATVSTIPRFLLPELWSLSVEPEIVFATNAASLGVSARFIHGLNDMTNLGGYVGTGSGGRGLRFGAHGTLDFYPDTPEQIGIGAAASLGYLSLSAGSQFDVRVTPYIHRRIKTKRNEFEPFGALPFGPSFGPSGTALGLSAVVGCLFEVTSQLVFSLELGVGVANESSQLAGGLVYFVN